MVIPAKRELTIRGDGTLDLSDDERAALGVGPGGEVLKLTADQGVLVTTREKLFLSALMVIGTALRKNGVTLEELIDSGAEIRADLVEGFYPRCLQG